MDRHTLSDRSPADTRRFHGDSGASLVEYALLLALIAVLCVIAVTVLGGSLQSSIDTNASKVADA